MNQQMDMHLKQDAVVGHDSRERLLGLLAFATFVVFFQAYAIAPMLPELAIFFHAEVRDVGLAIPAYLVPYGIATLGTGVLADRWGVGKVMLTSLTLFIVLVLATAFCRTLTALVVVRGITGIAASGIVPMALVGVLISPAIGGQGVMIVIAGMASLTLILLWSRREWLSRGAKMPAMSFP